MYAPAAAELPIRGDVVQLQQVVLNLIMNAMDAISGVQVGKRGNWRDDRAALVPTRKSGLATPVRV